MRARGWLWMVGLVVAGVLVWWWWRDANRPVEAPVSAAEVDAGVAREPEGATWPRAGTAETAGTAGTAGATAAGAADRPRVGTAPRRAVAFDASVRHTADPCAEIVEPEIPAEYERVTAQGITVAWSTDVTSPGPLDAPLRPLALAHLVAGLLEEAAVLTGTEPRAELAVIVDGSRDDFLARTRAPAWVGGLYDGGAIRIYAELPRELGVALSTLRHEVMHAQLHAAVGCIPFWFNEGLAMYFAGTPPVGEWLAMIRTADRFDPASLQDPRMEDVKDAEANLLYARSLAMVMYLGEARLRDAVRAAAAAGSEREALELWDRRVDADAVVDALARRVFGVAPGGELDAILGRGVICCHGIRTVTELGCRGAAVRVGELSWSDTSPVAPRATCRSRW